MTKGREATQAKRVAVARECITKANPNAYPLFHSDRGFQYANRVFYNSRRVQRNLDVRTPMGKHYGYPLAA